MGDDLELKPCPRCNGKVSIIRAHGAKWVSCSCGIQSSRYGEHIDDRRMIADWNKRPVDNDRALRIAELESRVETLERAIIKSSVRADYLGSLIDRMGVDCSRIIEVTAPLYYEVDLVTGTIPDYAKRYKIEEDAAHDRAKHAMGGFE